MTIRKEGNAFTVVKREDIETRYSIGIGSNGIKYVKRETANSDCLSISEGNSKIGKALSINFPIEYSCRHDCECYKSKACYACQGCYLFSDNQLIYSENFNFVVNHTEGEITSAINYLISLYPSYKLFRYFTIGDIPSYRFINVMASVARENPKKTFWAYSKKYDMVNHWLDSNNLPDNLVIIFSHWLNDDGSYFPMNNPYNLPTSEFIPYGKEELAETVTHICPCSDPTSKATCANCDHACYTLKRGESMALLEHSTRRTKKRDKAIHAAKKALK